MNLFTRTFSKIFKSSNQQELDNTKNLISAINSKEVTIKSLSEGEFKEKDIKPKTINQRGKFTRKCYSGELCFSERGSKKDFRREALRCPISWWNNIASRKDCRNENEVKVKL